MRHVSFESILDARSNPKLLNELSLARALRHTQDTAVHSFGIITAFRGGRTKAENIAAQNDLKATVRGMGYGFSQMQGHWRECQDTNVEYARCPPDKLKDVIEPSLLVNGISKQQILDLGRRFEQDAVVYAGADTKGQVTLLFKDGSSKNLGKFRADKVAQAYSKVKGSHTFAFEYVANTRAERLVERKWLRAQELTEMPHLEIGEPSPLPGDRRRFGVVDFQIEKYPLPSPEKAALMAALRKSGVVAPTRFGWLYFDPDGHVKRATDSQRKHLLQLPEFWEKYLMNIDDDEPTDLKGLIERLRESLKRVAG